MNHRYYITEGAQQLAEMDDKNSALRYAAKQAHIRKSVVKVFHYTGTFIKSFDGS